MDLAALLLSSPGPKGFFENPAWLIGLPLLALGALGMLAVLSPIELRWPQLPESMPEPELVPQPEGHPTPLVYIQVGLILAVITLVEVVFYYIDMAQGALLAVLLVLSIAKFALVVLWFMHLRFDNRIFSILFSGGLALVIALFMVVLATLGSNLV
jgi:cytochrome c oxidase subunit 4